MIFTVGHSTLPEADFLDLLRPVEVLVDVRSHPSSKWPQHRKESLEEALPRYGRRYVWEPDLGGWTEKYQQHRDFAISHGVDFDVYARGKFPKQRIAANLEPGASPIWYNQGLYDYSWFMATPEFLAAADRLLSLARSTNVAIMCCEAMWWKCHRSMIADYAFVRGRDSYHIMGTGFKAHSTAIGNRLQRYESGIKDAWVAHSVLLGHG